MSGLDPSALGLLPGKTPRRLALFGGTFDPPHVGHLVVAQDVVEVLELERLVFVPARRSPFKTGEEGTPPHVRLEMVRAATGGDPRFGVSDLELRRAGPSYTVDTVEQVRGALPEEVELFFVMGADQLAQFHEWKEPERIAELARLAVMAREGTDPAEIDCRVDCDYTVVPVTRLDISSTGIRERVAANRPVRWRIPDPVLRVIEAQQLYLKAAD